jgi:uncharacterized coiled-coil DUF342 family protein
MLGNLEKAEEVEKKSEELKQNAEQFRKKAKEVRCKFCLDYWLYIIIAIVIAVV